MKKWLLGSIVFLTACTTVLDSRAWADEGTEIELGEEGNEEGPENGVDGTVTIATHCTLSAPQWTPMGLERQPDGRFFLPLVNYNTDIGIGYGGLLSYAFRSEAGVEHGIRAVAYYSALKAQRQRLSWERSPGNSGIHLFVDARYDRTFYSNYFGIGNSLSPISPTLEGVDTSVQLLADDYYTKFTYSHAELSILGQRALAVKYGARVFAVARLRSIEVEAFDSARIEEDTGVVLPETYQSLLEADSPYGVNGGPGAQLQFGFMLDTRDRTVAPTEGSFHQLSVRGNYFGNTEGDGSPIYGGVNVTLQRYVPLRGRVMLASRLVGDFSFGDVPFYDLATFGAALPYSGVGGQLAGRGFELRHYVGKAKLLWGPEIRIHTYDFEVNGDSVAVSTALFAESGRVWGDYERLGEGASLHTALGAGLRFVYAKRLLIRLDVAHSLKGDDPTGVYLVFGHPY